MNAAHGVCLVHSAWHWLSYTELLNQLLPRETLHKEIIVWPTKTN